MTRTPAAVAPSAAVRYDSRRTLSVPAAVAPLCVVLASLAVSAHTTLFDFVLYDDDYLVYANPIIRDLGNAALFFDPSADRSRMGSEYLPLTTLSFALDYAVYGNRPGGFHATNVLLYALCSWLLYCVLRRFTSVRWAAAAGAILFAVHPLHTENFAWVAGRKSLLNGVFTLTSFLAYMKFRSGGGGRGRWYVVSLAAYVLAFLSKYTAVSLPGALLVYDVLFGAGRGEAGTGRRLLARAPSLAAAVLPFLLIGGALSVLAVRTGLRYEIIAPHENALQSAAVNDPIILLHYLRLLFFPVDQCAYYLWPLRDSMTVPAVAGYAVAASLCVAAWLVRRRAPQVAFAIVWFFVLLVPVSNVFPKVPELAERYLFQPSMALSFLFAWGLERTHHRVVGRPLARAASLGAAAAVLTVLGLASLERSLIWRDSFSLWNATLEHPMASPAAYDQLGLAHLQLRRDPEASVKIFEAGLDEMERRRMATSRRAAELKFHVVLALLEAREPGRAREKWRQLEASHAESPLASMRALVEGWTGDLRRHYPELFDAPPLQGAEGAPGGE